MKLKGRKRKDEKRPETLHAFVVDVVGTRESTSEQRTRPKRRTADELEELLPKILAEGNDLHDRNNTWPEVFRTLSETSKQELGEELTPGQIEGLYHRAKRRTKHRRKSLRSAT